MASLPGDMPFDDAELVRKVQSGDVASFEGLVRKYQDRVYNLCLRMTGHAEDARDLAQETFVRAFEAVGRFEHKSSFYTWLFRIAANLSFSWRRKERRIRIVSLHGQDDAAGPEATLQDGDQALKLRYPTRSASEAPVETLNRRQTQQAVAEALAKLEDDHRVVLVLREMEDLDYQAIAEILELPVGTVRSRLHRARLALRELLKTVVEKVG